MFRLSRHALILSLAAASCAPQYIEAKGDKNVDELAIVGGSNAPAGLYPHQVSIQTKSGFHFCGGSIIGDRHVLTAAHCVVGQRASQMRVEAGIVNLSSAGQIFSVSAIEVHPSYNSSTSDYDIALLTLSSSASSVGTVALVDADSEPVVVSPGTDAIVTGWGTLSEGGSSPDRLQQVTVPILSNSECNGAYSPHGQSITSRMICAGLLGVGGKDSCQGDSGGPLVVDGADGWAQAGVVSFGFGCADADFPGVYTRVSSFASWISARVPDVRFASDAPTDPGPVDPGNDGIVTLDTSSGGASISDVLGAGETHLYRIVLDSTSTVTASSASSLDLFGELRSSSGSVLASDDDSGSNLNFLVSKGGLSGEVIVAVRGYNGSVAGSYTLDVDVVSDGGASSDPQIGAGLPDLAANNTLSAGAVHDYAFDVVGTAGVPVDIFATSTGSTDVIGSFLTSSGALIVENDDISSNNRNFSIEASVVPGSYILRVRGYNNSAGAYAVTLGAQ